MADEDLQTPDDCQPPGWLRAVSVGINGTAACNGGAARTSHFLYPSLSVQCLHSHINSCIGGHSRRNQKFSSIPQAHGSELPSTEAGEK